MSFLATRGQSFPGFLHSNLYTIRRTPRQIELGPNVSVSTILHTFPAVANTDDFFKFLRQPHYHISSLRKRKLL